MLVKKVMDAYFKKFYDGGFKQGKIETAKNMLLNKLPLDVIVDCTKLSLSEIKKNSTIYAIKLSIPNPMKYTKVLELA